MKWRICPGVPTISEHHHDRTGRYCYWMWYGKFGKLWQVRDRVTGREVCCLNITQARRWIAAAKAFKLGRIFSTKVVTNVQKSPFKMTNVEIQVLKRKRMLCPRRG